MKKLLFIILIIPSICFSEIKGHIETGKDLYCNVAYTELQIGYSFKFYNLYIMPYANQQTWFEYRDLKGYPFNDIYKIGTEFKFENIKIDLSHFCSHKVISENSEFIYNYKPPADGNLTKLSIRYEF
jgi:hypothetical protein